MRRSCKNNVFVCLTVAVLSVFISCESQLQDIVQPATQPIEVGIYAGGTQTRTQMLPDGLSAVWSSDDVISLFAKNSSGSFVLNNQKFTTYGLDGEQGYFTSTLSSPMQEGTYNYYCCYPAPIKLAGDTGLRATFYLPDVQDGKAEGGVDIMVADPVTGPELNPVNVEDVEHNDVSFRMNRLTHHLRFWIPPGENKMGEPIKKIEITMPYKIAGDYYTNLDVPPSRYSDPNDINAKWYHDIGNGKPTMTLVLDEPLDESPYDNQQLAYAAIYPLTHQLYSNDYMDLILYSDSGMSYVYGIPLGGRRYLPGHSTMVMLKPTAPAIYCSVKIRTGKNNVGEPLHSVIIKSKSSGKELFRYNNTAGGFDYLEYTQEYKRASEKSTFDALVNAIKSGDAVLYYETANTLIDIPMTSDMMTLSGNSAVLELGDVPYLIFQNFDGAHPKTFNDDYKAGWVDNPNGMDGMLLNEFLSTPGWNASRFQIFEDYFMRISCMYEGAVMGYRKYCGRLDTPALKYLKQGSNATVVLEYDRAFYIPQGYNIDTSEPKARYYIGHHTKAEGSPIKGVDIYDNDNSIRNNATIIFDGDLPTKRYGNEDLANMVHKVHEINGLTNQSRLVFYVSTDETGIEFGGMNACYYLYLDNIKAYIKY